MHFFERIVNGRSYRVVAQSVWDSRRQQPVSRQVLLGPADPPPVADLAKTCTVGIKRVGDTGALGWVAEQLDVVRLIDQACGADGPAKGPSVGELTLGVALQRACAPGAKRDLAAFLDSSVARISCLPAGSFTGQAFHRRAAGVTVEQGSHDKPVNIVGRIVAFALPPTDGGVESRKLVNNQVERTQSITTPVLPPVLQPIHAIRPAQDLVVKDVGEPFHFNAVE